MGMLMETAEVDPFTDRGLGATVVRFIKGMASWFCLVGIMGVATHQAEQRTQETGSASPTGAGQPTPGPSPSEARPSPGTTTRILAYAQEARLPFYVLHQTPIVVIGYYVIQWDMNALFKFLLISFSSLLITLVVYEVAVRPFAAARFLFGMRPRRHD
jgi:hypothetical protein